MSAAGDGGPADPAALIEHYYAQGFTDGLPVLPPTADAVAAMVAAGGFAPNDPVATFEPQNRTVTAEKVAINAVLAGCLPAYMPVVCAALRAFCQPDFRGIGPVTTTASTALVVLVNGPLARTLEINAGDNLFGHGHRANATIGRALRLLVLNVLNIRPGQNDRSTLGNAGRYSFCFAENEADSPWEPLHVERGFRAGQSTVTLFATIGQTVVRTADSADPTPSLLSLADAMSFLGSHNILGQGELMVVLPGEMTARCRAAGWDKARVRRFLFDHARRTVAELKRVERIREPLQAGDEARWRHVTARPEEIIVVAAGGRVGHHAACLPGWGLDNPIRSVTVPIEIPGA